MLHHAERVKRDGKQMVEEYRDVEIIMLENGDRERAIH